MPSENGSLEYPCAIRDSNMETFCTEQLKFLPQSASLDKAFIHITQDTEDILKITNFSKVLGTGIV